MAAAVVAGDTPGFARSSTPVNDFVSRGVAKKCELVGKACPLYQVTHTGSSRWGTGSPS